MKRIVITVLSAAFMVGAVIYAKTNGVALFETAEGQQQKKGKVSSNVMAQSQIEALPLSADSSEKVAVSQAVQPVISKDGAMTYSSIQKEAVVGLYEGRHSDNPADNIFEVVIDKNLKNTDIVMLSYKLTGLADFAGVSMSVNDQKSMGGYLVSNAKDTVAHNEQLNPAWLRKGMNRFLFSVPAPSYGYRISDLQVRIIPSDSEQPLVVTGSTISYDNKAYVRGYVTDPSIKVVRVNGRSVDLSDGVFESVVALPSDRAVTVATLSNGKDVVKNVFVKSGVGADYVYEKSKDGFELVAHMDTDSDGSIVAPTASLTVKSGDMKKSMDLSVSSLIDKDMPSLDYGMYNVTDSFSGYRFLPHGELFEGEGATVAMGYDRTKIPNGYTEDDIKTYYFDLNTKHWVALKRDSIDKEKRMILSKTNHFTDMINGIIVVPESPETNGFAPTIMSDLKPANPVEKVQLIQAPTANSQGSANVSYSIEMPPARNGMAPNLTIQYSSDGGSGWLGDGWDLRVPTISVETRWGVPTYNPLYETETYLYDGQMMIENGVGLSHRNAGMPRQSGAVLFFPRREGTFSKIERIGDDPTNYVWQVTDAKGVKYTFGRLVKYMVDTEEVDESGVPVKKEKSHVEGSISGLSLNYSLGSLSTDSVVSEWRVTRVEDVHGDYVEYKYKNVSENILGNDLKASALYLDSICVGNVGEKPHTVVTFKNRASGKLKTRSSGNYGYLTSSNALLEDISIYFEGKYLRGYHFHYKKGDFYADLLDKITQFDADGNEFNSHSLVYKSMSGMPLYSDRIQEYKSEKSINGNLFEKLMEKFDSYDPKMSMLNANGTDFAYSAGGGLYLGWGPLAAGASYSYIYDKVYGKETLIDIDGDGIPDKVTCDGGKVKYQKGLVGTKDFGRVIPIPTLGSFFEHKASGNEWGNQDVIGVGNLSTGVNYTSMVEKNRTRIYFMDFNADGLVDVAYRGTVYFNRIGPDGVPSFYPYSYDTPNVMSRAKLPSSLVLTTGEYTKEQEDESPLLDAVRVWKAPFNGTIDIQSVVKVAPSQTSPEDNRKNYDGVHCAIQIGGEVVLREKNIGPSETRFLNATSKNVKKGDYVYFRTNSIKQGIGDLVSWDPVITYQSISLDGVTYTGTDIASNFVDENGLSLFRYRASEDYVWSFFNCLPVESGSALEIKGLPVKNVVTDADVKFVIKYRYYNGDATIQDQVPLVTFEYPREAVTSAGGVPVVSYINQNACEIGGDGIVRVTLPDDDNSYTLVFSIESDARIPFETDLSNESNGIWWRPVVSGYENLTILPSRPLYNHINSYAVPSTLVVKDRLLEVKSENPGKDVTADNSIYVKVSGETSDMSLFLYASDGRSIRLTNGSMLSSDEIESISGQKIRLVAYKNKNYTEQVNVKVSFERNYFIKENNTIINNLLSVSDDYAVTVYDSHSTSDLQLGLLFRGWGQFAYMGKDSDEGGLYERIDDGKWSSVVLSADEIQNQMGNMSTLGVEGAEGDDGGDSSFEMKFPDFQAMTFKLENGVSGYYAPSVVDESKNAIGVFVTRESQSSSRYVNPIIEELEVGTEAVDEYLGPWDAMYIQRRNRINVFSAGVTIPKGMPKVKDFLTGDFAENLEKYKEYIKKVKENDGVDDWSGGSDGSGKSWSWVYSHTVTNALDLNGDGYPDALHSGDFDDYKNSINVYYTTPNGSIRDYLIPSAFFSDSYNKTRGNGIVKSERSEHVLTLPVGGFSRSENNASESAGQNKEIAYTVTSAESQAVSNSKAEHDWYDVNGDGLPDMLFKEEVAFNLGYCFTPRVPFQKNSVLAAYSYGDTKAKAVSVPIKGKACVGAGYNVAKSGTGMTSYLLDVNADGLPDLIYANSGKMYAKINIGNGFGESVLIADKASSEESVSTSFAAHINGGVEIETPWGFTITPFLNGSTSWATTRTTSSFMDFDGDGYPDQLTSNDEESMSVVSSNIGATNKLQSVINPLGGSFDIDYTHTEASYDHPYGKWVMSSLTVSDGVSDNGPDQRFRFEYSGGKTDRRNREFLGFGKVKTINLDDDGNDYRKCIQLYDITNYFTAGAPKETLICGADESVKFMKSTSDYKLYKVTSGKSLSDPIIEENSSYIYLPTYKKIVAYENLGKDSLELSEELYEYDETYAHLSSYKFKNLTDNSGYLTVTKYIDKVDDDNHIIGLPVSVSTVGLDGVTYRHSEATYGDKFTPYAITSLKKTLNSAGDVAEYKMMYDKVGNVITQILPANDRRESMSYKYTYDRKYNMYVERVEDAFGYRSEMEDYDYRFGVPLTVRDMNGYSFKTELDNVGRVVKVLAPKEQEAGSDYTVKYVYEIHPSSGHPYVVADHFDLQHPDDPISVVTISDGVGRILQMKMDAEITAVNGNVSSAPEVKTISSGLLKYDALGRVVESYHPVVSDKGSVSFENSAKELKVTSTYDILGRPVLSNMYGENGSYDQTQFEYSIEEGKLASTVKFPNDSKQRQFIDGAGRVVRTSQYYTPMGTGATESGWVDVNYHYDPINQLSSYDDAGNNHVAYEYDMAGRPLSVSHPSVGSISLAYDNAGNLIKRRTQKLTDEGNAIEYGYEYNRLVSISYKDHPENNVFITYGGVNAHHNRIGKVALVQDGTGAQEFYYGRLGELTKVRRTIVIPNNAVATYTTEWQYDTWNRLMHMVYPDGELVKYNYDHGGKLVSVVGEKENKYTYVQNIGYDKYGQRVYMKYGNGTETFYGYEDVRRRMNSLQVFSPSSGGLIMNNLYKYDALDNITQIKNEVTPQLDVLGGRMSTDYTYDCWSRLISSHGEYTGAQGENGVKSASYDLYMSYDKLYNITNKSLDMHQTNIQFDGTLHAGHVLNYSYDESNPFKLMSVSSNEYRTEDLEKKDENTVRTNVAYDFDSNGNLIEARSDKVTVGNTESGYTEDSRDAISKINYLWDDENRLIAINEGGFVSRYWYDANGERIIKMSGGKDAVFLNGAISSESLSDIGVRFTAYVSPYMVASEKGNYTKHIYVGRERIVSKLGDVQSFGADPRRVAKAGDDVEELKAPVNFASIYSNQTQQIPMTYDVFELPYNGKSNDDYTNGSCCGGEEESSSDNMDEGDKVNAEKEIYFYHSDHLGSSSYITDIDGDVTQHIEYIPYGEVFVDEHKGAWSTPYLFNAKELDEETGLYYYGARYLNPKDTRWLSVDPMFETYPGMSPYNYCMNNPIKYIDPTGMLTEDQANERMQELLTNADPNSYFSVEKDDKGEYYVDCGAHNGSSRKDYELPTSRLNSSPVEKNYTQEGGVWVSGLMTSSEERQSRYVDGNIDNFNTAFVPGTELGLLLEWLSKVLPKGHSSSDGKSKFVPKEDYVRTEISYDYRFTTMGTDSRVSDYKKDDITKVDKIMCVREITYDGKTGKVKSCRLLSEDVVQSVDNIKPGKNSTGRNAEDVFYEELNSRNP
ncbi:MAG: hypothetical protein MJZ30_02055 [Paludibacteraceae bacterium]|nr:hypothetical protein [Paludibacteraceae bacterium]